MAKKNVLNQLEELKQKAIKTKEDYAGALEKAEDEVETLTREIADSEVNLKEIYKSYVLGDVSIDAWQTEKEISDKKKAVLSIAQKKVADIDGLLKGELAGIHTEYRAVSQDYLQEKNKAQSKLHYQLALAKKNYLESVAQASQECIQVTRYGAVFGQLEVDAGLKDFNYHDGRPSFASFFPIPVNVALNSAFYDGSLPTGYQLQEAFDSGKVSQEVLNEIEEGKEKGYLE